MFRLFRRLHGCFLFREAQVAATLLLSNGGLVKHRLVDYELGLVLVDAAILSYAALLVGSPTNRHHFDVFLLFRRSLSNCLFLYMRGLGFFGHCKILRLLIALSLKHGSLLLGLACSHCLKLTLIVRARFVLSSLCARDALSNHWLHFTLGFSRGACRGAVKVQTAVTTLGSLALHLLGLPVLVEDLRSVQECKLLGEGLVRAV
uniref:Uncharacterized protein n=1 Tax=Favella ehrenbergii TaxID=182087 RepID=A0A7S3MMM1_9SPIT|mmetsp:Transcript_19519/g.24123  ORF Transcript_19519/g.24123 Transcript_19519/m.24123 type:complete len:204 (+) Transcript_19519:362-973(+)